MHSGLPQHSQIANRKQNAQLSGAHFVIRDFEVAQDIGGEIDLNRQHQIGDEQSECDQGSHVSGDSKAAEKEESAEGVHNVVNVKAIAWTGVVTEAGKGAVE